MAEQAKLTIPQMEKMLPTMDVEQVQACIDQLTTSLKTGAIPMRDQQSRDIANGMVGKLNARRAELAASKPAEVAEPQGDAETAEAAEVVEDAPGEADSDQDIDMEPALETQDPGIAEGDREESPPADEVTKHTANA